MGAYAGLFSVTLSHNYYSNGQIPVFAVTPDTATANLFKKFSLVLQQTDTGFGVFYDTGLFSPAQASMLFAGKKLSILLSIPETSFFYYTNLPAYTNSVLCFSNAGHANTGQQGAPAPLTRSGFAGQADVYQLSMPAFSIPVSNSKQTVTLTDALGREVPPAHTTAGGTQYANLDGMYTLHQGTAITNLYCSAAVYTGHPTAVFDIYLPDPQIAPPYAICDGTGQPGNFIVSFDACAAMWQYYIVNKTNMAVNNLSISSPDNKIKFVYNGDVNIAGDAAQAFISDAAIKLQQHPTGQYSLVVRQNTGRTSVISESLPFPSPSTLKTEGNTTYLSALVYI